MVVLFAAVVLKSWWATGSLLPESRLTPIACGAFSLYFFVGACAVWRKRRRSRDPAAGTCQGQS